jgi:hypothetical protein
VRAFAAIFFSVSPPDLREFARRKEVPVRVDGKLAKNADGTQLMEWITTGWRADDVSVLLMKVCAGQGVWSMQERVRGRGAAHDGAKRVVGLGKIRSGR